MIFTILKVIGIILLVVLALILAVVLCILLVPVKYRAVGSFDNTDIRAKVHASWLLHLFALHIEYAREADGYIRLAFVKRKLFEDSDSDYEEYEDESEYEEYEDESDYENDEYDEKPAESDSGADNYETLYIDSMDDDAKAEDKGCENTGDEPEISADESEYVADEQTEDESTAQTHQKTYKKRSEKSHKKSHKKRFKDKSEKIKTGIDKLKREYSDERNKAAFLHLKEELFIILKRICPRRLKLTMVYSTGSPDTTGISLGILACFPVGYTNRWRITPDFESEKPYAKGSFDIKGHVIVISILAATLRILFDKNCRRLYNRISR